MKTLKMRILMVVLSFLIPVAGSAAEESDTAIAQLLDGLHEDASVADFDSYFARYTPDAVFLGTDKTERWTLSEFKTYAKPLFAQGRGWTYTSVERHIEGNGDTRWFDEILWNEKYGHCRGTGVVVASPEGWKVKHYSLTFLIPNDAAEAATALGIAAENPN